jgi:hypothetical protein
MNSVNVTLVGAGTESVVVLSSVVTSVDVIVLSSVEKEKRVVGATIVVGTMTRLV